MRKLKSIDRRILYELLRNSRRSDRKLAKKLESSQPTISRRRKKLESEVIHGYTSVLNWEKLGIELVAFTFLKYAKKNMKRERLEADLKQMREWLSQRPEVFWALQGSGMEWDCMCISFHKDYSSFRAFRKGIDIDLSEILEETRSFIAKTDPRVALKPFHFKYLEELVKDGG